MKRLLGTLSVLALLVLAYVGVAAWAGNRVPAGSTVQGVAIGGLDRAAARQRLDTQLAARADQPLTLTADSASTVLVPAEAGLSVDVTATLDQLTGFTLDPRSLVSHLRGTGAMLRWRVLPAG